MAQQNNILYVGGLDENVTEETIHAAFIPFGELRSVQLPKDYKEDKIRGFAFVEFDLEEDCADALENMDGAELFGKTLSCTIAKTMSKTPHGKAIWSADEWIKDNLGSNVVVEDKIEEMSNTK